MSDLQPWASLICKFLGGKLVKPVSCLIISSLPAKILATALVTFSSSRKVLKVKIILTNTRRKFIENFIAPWRFHYTLLKKDSFRFIFFLPGFDMEEVDKCSACLGQPHPQPRPLHTHNSSTTEKNALFFFKMWNFEFLRRLLIYLRHMHVI